MRVIILTILSIYSLTHGYKVLRNQKDWDPNKYARRHGVIVTDVEKFKKVSAITRVFWGIMGIVLVLTITIFRGFIDKEKWLWILLLILLIGQSISTIKILKHMAWDESWDDTEE